MAVLTEKTRARQTRVKQKTNFSKNGLENDLNTESSQKLLFYLLEKIDKLDHKLDDKADKLNDKIDKLDHKLDDKADKLNNKIDKLDEKLNDKVDKLDERLNNKIDSRFLWTIGIMFTGFIGIITIILSKY